MSCNIQFYVACLTVSYMPRRVRKSFLGTAGLLYFTMSLGIWKTAMLSCGAWPENDQAAQLSMCSLTYSLIHFKVPKSTCCQGNIWEPWPNWASSKVYLDVQSIAYFLRRDSYFFRKLWMFVTNVKFRRKHSAVGLKPFLFHVVNQSTFTRNLQSEVPDSLSIDRNHQKLHYLQAHTNKDASSQWLIQKLIVSVVHCAMKAP